MNFCAEALGLRLSDRSVDIVAFMHTPRGSHCHLLAFVGSAGQGLQHTSWGVGRHVLGSNCFYRARDLWGGFAEYSFDIDYIPSTMQ